MIRWRKILVATDFSPSAEVALRSAESLARQVGGSLVVVHVVQPPPPGYTIRFSPRGGTDLLEEWERGSRETLERILTKARNRYSRIRTVIRVGKPWVEILEVAKREKAQAICLGISGHSAFERLLIGSTAENVVRRAEAPVLVTRDRAVGQVRRILVPVDFDAGSKRALDFTLERFPARTAVAALHVAVLPVPFDPTIGVIMPAEEDLEGELRAYLGKLARRVSLEVRMRADVTAGILEQAREHEADLIVIATHGRRGLARALLGSVAEKVVRHGECPVLVLPGPGRNWVPGEPARRRRSAGAVRSARKPRAQRPKGPLGRRARGPWTGQAHTGRGGPPGRRGGGSSAGKRKGGRRPQPSLKGGTT